MSYLPNLADMKGTISTDQLTAQTLNALGVSTSGSPGPVPGPSGPNFSDAEVPSGAADGVNTVFAFSNSPSPVKSLILFANGVLQTQNSDYTLTNNSISMTVAPKTGYAMIAWYRY